MTTNSQQAPGCLRLSRRLYFTHKSNKIHFMSSRSYIHPKFTGMRSKKKTIFPQKKKNKILFHQFSGSWYNVASYASDGRPIYDCATLDFQEDNLGYTLKETYVVLELGNRTQKSYLARVDPTFDAGNKAQFIVSYENAGEFSFF